MQDSVAVDNQCQQYAVLIPIAILRLAQCQKSNIVLSCLGVLPRSSHTAVCLYFPGSGVQYPDPVVVGGCVRIVVVKSER